MKQQIILLYLEDISLSWLIGEASVTSICDISKSFLGGGGKASESGDTDDFGVPLSTPPYPKETWECGPCVPIIVSGVDTILCSFVHGKQSITSEALLFPVFRFFGSSIVALPVGLNESPSSSSASLNVAQILTRSRLNMPVMWLNEHLILLALSPFHSCSTLLVLRYTRLDSCWLPCSLISSILYSCIQNACKILKYISAHIFRVFLLMAAINNTPNWHSVF